MSDTAQLLAHLHKQLESIQKDRTALRGNTKLTPKPLSEFSPNQNVHNFWTYLYNFVMTEDVKVYCPSTVDGLQSATEIAQKIVTAEGGDATTEVPPSPAAQAPAMPGGPGPMPMTQYTSQMGVKVQPNFTTLQTAAKDGKTGGTTQAQKNFFTKITAHTDYMQKNLSLYGPAGVGTLQKVRQAEGYAADGNVAALVRRVECAD